MIGKRSITLKKFIFNIKHHNEQHIGIKATMSADFTFAYDIKKLGGK